MSSPAPAPPRTGLSAPAGQVAAALGVVYVVWGSTYLGIGIVVEELPPLLAMGVRFVASGTLLAVIVAARVGVRALRVEPRQLASAALLGTLFVACGNGGVAVGELTVTTGLAALLVAAMPLWVVILRRLLGGERPRVVTWVGVLVGLSGIGFLARPGTVSGVETWGVLVILGGTMCWATGTFLSAGRVPLPANPFVTTVYEMLAGGLVMLVISTLTGAWAEVDVSAIHADTWWALAYLITIGSIAGYGAFVWLLAHAPVSLVTTYAFVNPVVAVFLGWLVLSESITGAVVLGGALALVGVALVVRGERPPPTPTPEA